MTVASMSQFYRDRKAHGVEYAAEHMRALGFDSVEWFETDYTEHMESSELTKSALERHGLSLCCYTVLVDLFSGDQASTEAHMLRHVQTAAELGAAYFQHTVFPSLPSSKELAVSFNEVYDGVIDLAESIARSCNELGMVCIYEPQGAYFNGIEHMAEFLSELRIRGCKVGVCGDSANSYFVDVDPKDFFERFSEDIYHVHLKDVIFSQNEIAAEKVRLSAGGAYICNADLGEGSVDLQGCFEVLRRAGYSRALSFEFGGSDELIKEKLDLVRRVVKNSEAEL